MTASVRLEEYESTVTISKSCRLFLRDEYSEERCVGTVVVDITDGEVTLYSADLMFNITRFERTEAMRAFRAYKDRLLKETEYVPSTTQ